GKCQCCCVANPCGSTGYEDHFPVKLTRGTFPFQDARFRQLDNGSNQGDQARLIARECKLDLRPCHWASKTHESSANLDCTSSSLVSSTSNTTVGTAASSPRNSAGPGNDIPLASLNCTRRALYRVDRESRFRPNSDLRPEHQTASRMICAT